MSAAIAILRGYDVNSEEVQSAVLISLLGAGAAGTLSKVGVELGTKSAVVTLQRLPGKVLVEINKKVGFRLLTKFGTKGSINLVKAVPLVGGGCKRCGRKSNRALCEVDVCALGGKSFVML